MPNSSPLPEPELSLEERVSRLEGKLGWRGVDFVMTLKMKLLSALLLIAGFVCAFIGLGIPNHYYQVALAVLLLALCYHRNWLCYPKKFTDWAFAFGNAVVLSMLLKLFIGGGRRFPFDWFRLPQLAGKKSEEGGGWYNVMPDLALQWQPSSLSEFVIDLTVVQTFLLVITLFGALFEFQPFVSFTAFLLVVVSIPALIGFDWNYVFPALVFVGIALYLQSPASDPEPD